MIDENASRVHEYPAIHMPVPLSVRDRGSRERLIALAREEPRLAILDSDVLLRREREHINHKRGSACLSCSALGVKRVACAAHIGPAHVTQEKGIERIRF